MSLASIKDNFKNEAIFYSEDSIMNRPTVIAYDKQFRWSWMATQLNTFVVATDFGQDLVTVDTLEQHLSASFQYAKDNYNGWPRGLQSGLGVVTIILSSNIDEAAKAYCLKLKSGKKWAGFTIPVVIDSTSNQVYKFESKPIWGMIYYPFFEQLIKSVCQ